MFINGSWADNSLCHVYNREYVHAMYSDGKPAYHFIKVLWKNINFYIGNWNKKSTMKLLNMFKMYYLIHKYIYWQKHSAGVESQT